MKNRKKESGAGLDFDPVRGISITLSAQLMRIYISIHAHSTASFLLSFVYTFFYISFLLSFQPLYSLLSCAVHAILNTHPLSEHLCPITPVIKSCFVNFALSVMSEPSENIFDTTGPLVSAPVDVSELQPEYAQHDGFSRKAKVAEPLERRCSL